MTAPLIKKKSPKEKRATAKQIRGVQNILSGKYKTKAKALRDAGYSDSMALDPDKFMATKGVQAIIERIDEVSVDRYQMPIQSKLVEVWLKGLEAVKPYGKDANLYPDYPTRLKYAEALSTVLGVKTREPEAKQANQFNFFSISGDQREEFDKSFVEFIKSKVTRRTTEER